MKKTAILLCVPVLVLGLFPSAYPRTQDALSQAVIGLLDEPAPPPAILKVVADAASAVKLSCR